MVAHSLGAASDENRGCVFRHAEVVVDSGDDISSEEMVSADLFR